MATIIVDTTLDENDGNVSLRDAIAAASSGDTITFASGPGEAFETGGTIPLNPALGALVVSSVVTIDGDIDADGAPDVTVAGEAPVFASAGNGGDGGQGGPGGPGGDAETATGFTNTVFLGIGLDAAPATPSRRSMTVSTPGAATTALPATSNTTEPPERPRWYFL